MVAVSEPTPDRAAARPAVERRDRRARVEDLLVDGLSHAKVWAIVSEQFGVSVVTVRNDVRLVLKRWAKEDTTRSWQRRTRVIRRLERIAAKAEAANDLAQARMATRDIGRLLGMGNRLEVDVGVRGTVVHVHRPADPEAWATAVLECAAEIGVLPPGLVVNVPAVVKTETNGHEGNGHA